VPLQQLRRILNPPRFSQNNQGVSRMIIMLLLMEEYLQIIPACVLLSSQKIIPQKIRNQQVGTSNLLPGSPHIRVCGVARSTIQPYCEFCVRRRRLITWAASGSALSPFPRQGQGRMACRNRCNNRCCLFTCSGDCRGKGIQRPNKSTLSMNPEGVLICPGEVLLVLPG